MMSEFKEFSSSGLPDCGISFLTDFWKEKYLQEYIKNGGSKIKFVTGRKGSGKTHFLRLTAALAKVENYKTVHFSAKDVWMHDFREIYVAKLKERRDRMKKYKKPVVKIKLTNHKTNNRRFGIDAADSGCGMCKVFK